VLNIDLWRIIMKVENKKERAASMIEYVLLVALIALIAIVAIRAVGTQTSAKFSSVGSALSSN